MAASAVQLACDVHRSGPEPIASLPGRTHVEPALGLMRALISTAFKDAKVCRHGSPTDDAMAAVEWLLTDPPSKWVTPPGSFAWACSWLSFDVEKVRQCGLPEVQCVYLAGGD